jgi:hypothetical protein
MALSEKGARAVLAGLVVCLVGAALLVDLPRASEGQFWGDGATYYAMAWSLAEDLDVRYQADDLLRVKREFPMGPQGVFLKRTSGALALDGGAGLPWLRRSEERGIFFAKAFTYPLAAAPLVRLLGTRGLLVTNALFLGLALVAAYGEARRRSGPGAGVAVAASLLFGTVAPAYLVWPTPEAFGLGLIAGSLWAWRCQRPVVSALLLGVAVYTKPYNLLLALPLGVEPLLQRDRPFPARALESVRRGAVTAAATLALFGLTWAFTGEANYQGGERKTFSGRFPLESPEVTFGNSGIWMTTNRLGPGVEGDETERGRGEGPPRAAGEIEASFLRNLGYFWVGRFGGLLPYFLPVAVALALFLAAGPRDARGWLAVAALVVSWLFYVRMIPDNWYGGSGTLGNRYFLNLLPLAAVFVPRGREWLVAAAALLSLAAFVGPLLGAPMASALHPGRHTLRPAFRLFPPELTMLNDLSVFNETWRKKRPFGDTEGDAHKGWPADPEAYYLYFLDDGTYGREEAEGGPGFWLRGGRSAEVVLRALEPVRRMRLEVTGGPAGDDVEIRLGRKEQRLLVAPGRKGEAVLEAGPGFAYYDTFLHPLHLRSRRGAPVARVGAPGDSRSLGAFVRIRLEVEKRPRPATRP